MTPFVWTVLVIESEKVYLYSQLVSDESSVKLILYLEFQQNNKYNYSLFIVLHGVGRL